MKILETQRLTIRELNLDDADFLHRYSNEPAARAELPDEVLEDKAHAEALINTFIGNYPDKYPLVYGIELSKRRLLIGHVGISRIPEGVEIGYAIAEAFQNKGYAAEAVMAFSPWVKRSMALDRLYALAKETNTASWRVLERAGYMFMNKETRQAWGQESVFEIYVY